jgi:hypothetical protein
LAKAENGWIANLLIPFRLTGNFFVKIFVVDKMHIGTDRFVTHDFVAVM